MEDQLIYKCYKCGHEFTDADWQKNENGEFYFECPECHTVWFKEDVESPAVETNED